MKNILIALTVLVFVLPGAFGQESPTKAPGKITIALAKLNTFYTDESGQGKFAIIHLDKKNAREAVACAEAQTGKKVEQIDEK